MKSYDLVVLGSGPAGEKAAVKAAYCGYSVACVEKQPVCGGCAINAGGLPSQALKETALFLSGRWIETLQPLRRPLEREATVKDFLHRKNIVREIASREAKENILCHGVDLYEGVASFEDPHRIRISGTSEEVIEGKFILIATGSRPFHPPSIPFDFERVHDSTSIFEIERFPETICIVGGGAVGAEFSTTFGLLGTKVHLVSLSDRIVSFMDGEIIDELVKTMKAKGIEIYLKDTAVSLDVPKGQEPMTVHLRSGREILVDTYLHAAGRVGNVEGLGLDRIGVELGNRDFILVDEKLQTTVKHIYAAGDVIGYPGLAAVSVDQGRMAVAHMFQTHDLEQINETMPFGVYTAPEIAGTGMTEEQARAAGIDYVTGKAYDKQTIRGKIVGSTEGVLKLVIRRDDLRIIGVHILGPSAAELIHYGLLLVQKKVGVMEVICSVFNSPTIHELYKYACYDAFCSMAGKRMKATVEI